MITCPNCGQLVRDDQRFCGACGTDVQAAPAVSARAGMPGEDQTSPYAYAQPPGYGYEMQAPAERPVAGRLLLIGGALLLAVCCAFACGLVFGFEIIPTALGLTTGPALTPTPKPTLPPSGLNLLQMVIQFVV